jgi:hypothetical protein
LKKKSRTSRLSTDETIFFAGTKLIFVQKCH